MKNKTAFKLFIIVILSILFRLWFIDKPQGLWNDEYVSWYIATRSNFTEFLTDMLRNCHTPLYYIYIKLWLLFFPDNDFSLRISSVVPSVCTVIVMYFVGKEFRNSNLGLLCAFLTCISSFNIYFAQEVRLYSLLVLFSAISLLFFIKLTKSKTKLNFIIFFVINALICALHTLGIIYSLLNIFFLFVYLYKNDTDYKNKMNNLMKAFKYILPFILVAVLLTPFWFSIAFSQSLSQFWSRFSFAKVLFNIADYFSPIQTNIINTPDTFLTYALTITYFIFGVVSSVIALIALYRAVCEKDKTLNYNLLACLGFFITLILLSLSDKMVLITKYSCEIYPALILAISYGFTLLGKKHLLAYIFIGLNLFYLCSASDSAPKMQRTEGHFAVVSLLRNSRLKHTDTVLLTYYDVDKFERYLSNNNEYNFKSINKFNFNEFLFDDEDYTRTIKHGQRLYRDYFRTYPNPKTLDKLWKNYLGNMKKGDRIGIVFLDTVSFLSKDNILDIVDEDSEYFKTPFIFLVFSALRNNILYSLKDNFKLDTITQSGDWTLFVYEKTN